MRPIDTIMAKYDLKPGDVISVKSDFKSKCERYLVKRHSIKKLYRDGTIGEEVPPKQMFNILEDSKVVI